jgi:hypothetical protein
MIEMNGLYSHEQNTETQVSLLLKQDSNDASAISHKVVLKMLLLSLSCSTY